MQIQSISILCRDKKNMIVVPTTERMETIMSIEVCLIPRININYKENGGKENFSCKSKALISCIPTRRAWLKCPITRRMKILWESKFNSFHQWTLIVRKMVKIKAFLANKKYQYRVSQWGDYDCRAPQQKNGDCYEYLSLFHFTDGH